MAAIFLTNTLSRKKEKFTPIKKGKVGIYSCGPTVYRNIHIGNLRTYIAADLLKRMFLYNGYKVKHIKNITDVGHLRTTGADEAYDPIINEALKEGKSPLGIAQKYTKEYLKDEKNLNIITADKNPKATEHIEQMIELIKILLQKGFAYEAERKVLDGETRAKPEGTRGSGTIYFDVQKFKEYGKLSGNTLEKADQLLEAVRVSAETDKKDSADFALWKKGESDRAMLWDSPWGKGFPGWHIECSAMSMTYLGDSFDIHTGGEDLIFPHHEDEIAQSEAATGKKFVNLWSHAGFLLVDGQKMARSAGNYYVLADIVAKGFDPLAFRYLALTAHYKNRLNFTWKGLEASATSLNNLYREFSSYGEPKIGCAGFEQRFLEAINDDLNTPKALEVVWGLIKSNYPSSAKARSLMKFDEVLGLGLSGLTKEKVPEEVKKLVEKREEARKNKDFTESDRLRAEIAEVGYEVVDTDSGPKLKRIIQ